MANTSLDVINLDYDAILASLKRYVAADATFKSYDLDQGGMAALLRVLAYSQFNETFLLNMSVSESFLDSAQLRASVASHVKELNYVMGSAKSARARVTMEWDGPSPVYYVQKGSTLSGLVKGAGAVTFTVPETMTVTGTNGHFSVTLDVYEGPYVADAWVVDSTNPSNRFVLTNDGADTSSLSVMVYEPGSTNPTNYTYSTTMLGVTDASLVWFLQVSERGQYEVMLGDGVLGHRPPDGSRVVAEYRVTKGADGNGVTRLTAGFNPYPGDATNIVTTTVTSSSGGTPEESIEEARFRAPRWFRVQERAFADEDYSILLTEEFAEIRDAVAVGGENAEPPQYGRVLVSIALHDSDKVSDSRRDAYESFLSKRVPLGLRPVVIEPDHSWVKMSARVWYDPGLDVTTPAAVRAAATAAIQAWCDVELGGFGAKMAISRLQAAIDDSARSIVSSEVTFSVYKTLAVTTGAAEHQRVLMGFTIAQTATDPSIDPTRRQVEAYTAWTDVFLLSGTRVFIADDGLGSMRVVSLGRYGATVGTVDYATGLIDMPALLVDSYTGDGLRVYAKPGHEYVATPVSTILSLSDDLTVDVVAI